MAFLDKHKIIETNAFLLMVLSLVVVAIGGIVEIAPLFWIQNTIETVDGMRPYTPLELAGRDIYIRAKRALRVHLAHLRAARAPAQPRLSPVYVCSSCAPWSLLFAVVSRS